MNREWKDCSLRGMASDIYLGNQRKEVEMIHYLNFCDWGKAIVAFTAMEKIMENTNIIDYRTC